jgi:SAM-dependent methyltransferase
LRGGKMSTFDDEVSKNRIRLTEIANKYNTDKGDHNSKYSYIYDSFFHLWRDRPIRILEIGIAGGGSLRMWEEYFPNASVYGLDINPNCKVYESDRTKVFIGDATDMDFIRREVFPVTGTEFDIIIDDGSHRNDHIIKTMTSLFPHVVFGGYYVVEDYLVTAIKGSEWYQPYQGFETFFEFMAYLHQEQNFRGVADKPFEFRDQRVHPVYHNTQSDKQGVTIWNEGVYGVSVFTNICIVEKQNRLEIKNL